MLDELARYCVCPKCRGGVKVLGGDLYCDRCEQRYEVLDGIAKLLPEYKEEVRERYFRNYEAIAQDDLGKPIVENRYSLLHSALVKFIGDVRGKTVLDIGSAYGSYLTRLEAKCKVAVDLALPYLRTIPASSNIMRVWGDAEQLPVKLELFDIVIVSDVLEHMLKPEALVALLAEECKPDVRIIAHVPWQESLDQYKDVRYEFVHLRSFAEYSFRRLFKDFDIKKERRTLPRLSDPIIFQLVGWLPRSMYNAIVKMYFTTELAFIEYAYRARWIRELPRRERWLLALYPAQCKILELRRYARRPSGLLRRAIQYWWKRVETKSGK